MINSLIVYIKENKKIAILLITAVCLLLVGNIFTFDNKDDTDMKKIVKGEKLNVNTLEKILSNIKGAGKVDVFISYENDGEIEYVCDTKYVSDKGESSEKKHLVVNKEPVIKAYVNAKVKGVLVTATGADNLNVKNSLLRSVKAVTGVGYDRISVEVGVK